MSRFSPTVLPQPDGAGAAIAQGLANGFQNFLAIRTARQARARQQQQDQAAAQQQQFTNALRLRQMALQEQAAQRQQEQQSREDAQSGYTPASDMTVDLGPLGQALAGQAGGAGVTGAVLEQTPVSTLHTPASYDPDKSQALAVARAGRGATAEMQAALREQRIRDYQQAGLSADDAAAAADNPALATRLLAPARPAASRSSTASPARTATRQNLQAVRGQLADTQRQMAPLVSATATESLIPNNPRYAADSTALAGFRQRADSLQATADSLAAALQRMPATGTDPEATVNRAVPLAPLPQSDTTTTRRPLPSRGEVFTQPSDGTPFVSPPPAALTRPPLGSRAAAASQPGTGARRRPSRAEQQQASAEFEAANRRAARMMVPDSVPGAAQMNAQVRDALLHDLHAIAQKYGMGPTLSGSRQ